MPLKITYLLTGMIEKLQSLLRQKNSSMSIWVTSLLTTSEILNMILEKYQITSDQENYGLFLVKDSGGMYI